MEITPLSKQLIDRILDRVSAKVGRYSPAQSSISTVRGALVSSEAQNTVYVNCQSETVTALARVIQSYDHSDVDLLLNNIAGRFSREPGLFISRLLGLRPRWKKVPLTGTLADEYMRHFELYRLGVLLIAVAANARERHTAWNPEAASRAADAQATGSAVAQLSAEERRASEIYGNSPTLQGYEKRNHVSEERVLRFLLESRDRVASEERLARGIIEPGEFRMKDLETEYPLTLLAEALRQGDKITSSFAKRLVSMWAGPLDYYLSRRGKLEPEVERLIALKLPPKNNVDISLFDDPRDAHDSLPFKSAVRIVRIATWLKENHAAGGGGVAHSQPLTPVTAAQSLGIAGQWSQAGLAMQSAVIFRGLPL